MNINMNQLRSFYLAAKHRSITKAAEELFVTPPAISMQVKKLEKWLGFRLLVKDSKTIRLTREAQDLFEQSEQIFKNVEKLERQLEKEMRARKAEIIIGSHYIPAKYIMPKLIEQLKHLQPQLTFKVVLDTVPVLMEKLKNHDIHFVLSAAPPSYPSIHSIPLFSEEMVLVARAGSKHMKNREVTAGTFKDLPLLLPERQTGVFHLIDDFFAANDISPCILMDNISADVIKNFLLQDLGAALLFRFSVQDKINNGELQEIEIAESTPKAQFSLYYYGDKDVVPGVEAIISSFANTHFERSQFL